MTRLAVFLDGTWSRPADRTNVYRLWEATTQDDAQRKLYLDGVGTEAFRWLRGGVLGFGTSGKIVQAYDWLRERYADGDEIFVFGFSRGAYAARSLAGMISRCGLLPPGAPAAAVERAYRRYADKQQGLAEGSRYVDIHLVGVWDTVGALGVPWGNVPGLSRRWTLFHNTSPGPRYRNMFHALAVDEDRPDFTPTLWTSGERPEDHVELQPHQRLEQCWFAGSHSDVGGGHGGSDLSRIPLAWMFDRAQECGLTFDRKLTSDADDHLAPVDDGPVIWLMRRFRPRPRPIGQEWTETAAGRARPLREFVHGSVFDRWRDVRGYRGPNLRTWAAEVGHVDPGAVHGTIPAR